MNRRSFWKWISAFLVPMVGHGQDVVLKAQDIANNAIRVGVDFSYLSFVFSVAMLAVVLVLVSISMGIGSLIQELRKSKGDRP